MTNQPATALLRNSSPKAISTSACCDHNQALQVLQALAACSWLDDDPCDNEELALAKQQGRSVIVASSLNQRCRA